MREPRKRSPSRRETSGSSTWTAWKINARSQLRMSITNLLEQPTQSDSRYFGSGIEEANVVTADAPATVLLRYETSF
jgi:hypothetical protein